MSRVTIQRIMDNVQKNNNPCQVKKYQSTNAKTAEHFYSVILKSYNTEIMSKNIFLTDVHMRRSALKKATKRSYGVTSTAFNGLHCDPSVITPRTNHFTLWLSLPLVRLVLLPFLPSSWQNLKWMLQTGVHELRTNLFSTDVRSKTELP